MAGESSEHCRQTFNRTIVELKQYLPSSFRKIPLSFNRTIVELKPHWDVQLHGSL